MKHLNVKLPFKRRLRTKTDYEARRYLLSGNTARLVVRKTNRYMIVQVVQSESAQDKVISTTTSKELSKYGFSEGYSMKNLAASYLTGFLAASKVMKDTKKLILDIGMLKSTKGNRLYAVLKGAVDAGLDIPHSEKILPPMEEIKGKTKNDVDKAVEKIKESFK
ncbi:MAG: 50S ribosomal protein L18 [Nanoarchaeota archaeon]|nr:50S ribosomal protein L18 [Nanoarchaeota archaeon]